MIMNLTSKSIVNILGKNNELLRVDFSSIYLAILWQTLCTIKVFSYVASYV